jgi:hypothetical protein
MRPRCCHIEAFKLACKLAQLFFVGVLAGAAQKGHSRLNLGGSREIRAVSA